MGLWLSNLFPPGIFTETFMIHAFVTGTVVAIVSGLVGFFVVLRGSTFVVHALPKVGFAGAAGAVLLHVHPLMGLTTFSVLGALHIGWLGKNERRDVVTALTLVAALGIGALFLSLGYSTGAYALLFGQLVGVSSNDMYDTVILAAVSLSILAVLYRPLLFSSLSADMAEARGISIRFVEMAFLVVVGLATAITVPVVGTLLCFSLTVAPAATAQLLSHRPCLSLVLSTSISVVSVWMALVLGYDTGWPVGFYVAVVSTAFYVAARLLSVFRHSTGRRKPRFLQSVPTHVNVNQG
jgi:zinc/manganese transport system permease protein